MRWLWEEVRRSRRLLKDGKITEAVHAINAAIRLDPKIDYFIKKADLLQMQKKLWRLFQKINLSYLHQTKI